MSKPEIRNYSVIQEFLLNKLDLIVHRIFFWETDSKRIGKCIRFLHHGSMYILGIVLFLVHTIMPSYFLFFIVYLVCICIWLQHIFTGGCIVSKLEQKLIGDETSFVDPILEAFHMPVTPENTTGVVILGSTVVISMLTLELVSRTILNIQSYLRF